MGLLIETSWISREMWTKPPYLNKIIMIALTFAEKDLKYNWEYYKKRFLGGRDE